MQLQLILISCDYFNSSYKTPDCGNLPSPWPNSRHLPRGAGRAAVLFHGGWHSNLSLWRFQHSLDKPYATDFHSVLSSFDLKRLTTTSTHKSGNRLDLIYTRDFTADKILVQPLHISDHFFIKFTLHFATRVPPTPLPVTFRRNIRSLSPSHLSSVASLLSSLTYPFLISGCEYSYWHFMLYLNLFFRQHLSSLLQASTGCPFEPLVIRWSSWASDQTLSGREKTAQNKWSVGPKYVSTVAFIFLCWSPHCQILTFPQQDQQGSRRAYSLQNI